MNLNTEQLESFEKVSFWYNKAVGKIAKRYHRGIGQDKEARYAKAVALAIEETEEIDRRYSQVLGGACSVDHFKQSVSDWFYKVKNGMDAVDKAAKEAKEPWCDYHDERKKE